jgi:lycopene cyclase domain-containing protein
MSYPELTALVLGIFAIYTVLVRKNLRARPLLVTALVMLTLTLIFDNVIIGTGIVAYDQEKLLGILLTR